MNAYIGIAVTVAALIALAVAIYKGCPILIASPICGAIVLIGNGYPLLEGLTDPFIGEAAGFFKSWFLFFLLGAILGVTLERTGAASSIAKAVSQKFGPKFAIPAVVAVCAILMFGGVSGFVVVFSVYPFAVELFREANIPRKYMVAAIATPCAGFATWVGGSPMTQNVIPMQSLGTEATAGLVVSLICMVFFIGLSLLYLNHEIKKDQAKGLGFEFRETLGAISDEQLPNPAISVLPLVLVFVTFAFLKLNILYSLLIGVISALLLLRKQYQGKLLEILKDGCVGATNNMVNVAMIVAVAGAFKATDTFQFVVDSLLNLPFDPLISAAIAVNVVAGLTASSTGGVQVALPVIGQPFIAMGADPAALHRVASISSSCMDSMPHSGWLNSTNELCKTTQKESYKPFAVICIGIAFLTTVLSIVLFMLFPVLCNY